MDCNHGAGRRNRKLPVGQGAAGRDGHGEPFLPARPPANAGEADGGRARRRKLS